ncbi:MAG: class I SAM-dependent methyltransferase [Candidatus Cloacimonetes bacterium]|nr:class I SAM-dependent methyltransferase [Candidatus Cloacimonadota bacterium]
MEYEPLKNLLENVISVFPCLRKLLYLQFNIIFLRQRYVFREIRNLFHNTDKIKLYDAGAGFCQYSNFVLSHWPESTAFATDLKTNYLRFFANYAADKYPGRFFYKSADLQIFKPANKYDLALAIDILEHIEDDESAIKNLKEALKPGGYLIISTPSDLDEAAKFTSEHIRAGYHKEDLEEKLQQAGFSIIKSIFTYGTFGSLSWKLMLKLPMQITSKKLYIILPIYYLLIYPVCEILMRIDMKTDNKKGTGILIVAQS